MTEPKTALDNYLTTWPLHIVWGTTGVGKTGLLSSLVDLPHLHPVLMIDADSGGETSRSLEGAGRFERRTPSDPDMDVVALTQWLVAEIHRARTGDYGAIGIEGIGRIYSLFQGESALGLLEDPKANLKGLTAALDGNKGRASYKAGAALVKGVVTSIAMLRRAKAGQAKAGKRGGLVVVTLTTRFAQVTRGGQMVETQAPELSKNATASLMSESDGCYEFRRRGAKTQILVDADEDCEFRKARGPGTAATLAALANPTFSDILNAFANGNAPTATTPNPEST